MYYKFRRTISSVRHEVSFSLRKCPTSSRTIPVLLHHQEIYCVYVFIYCFNHLHFFTIPFISSIDVSKEIYEIVPFYPITDQLFQFLLRRHFSSCFNIFCSWEMCLPLRITKIVTNIV